MDTIKALEKAIEAIDLQIAKVHQLNKASHELKRELKKQLESSADERQTEE